MEDLKKGARITLRVDRLSLGGDGVARAGGAVVFVPYGSPGDVLDVELVDVRRNFARARLIRVLEPSPVRVTPPCQYHYQTPSLPPPPLWGRTEVGGEGQSMPTPHPNPANRLRGLQPFRGIRWAAGLPPQGGKEIGGALFCGGCLWQHMNYEFQLDAKRQLVEETLERIGGLQDIEVHPTLGMKDPWRYRNKVQQPVGWDGDRAVSGFYAPGSHDLVPIEDCLVQPEGSVAILNRVRSLLHPRHRGWLRHLLIRTSQKGEALLVFVTQTDDFPHETQILSALSREFPQLIGVHQNINPGKTNVILGRQWRKCAGEDSLEEQLGPLRFKLSPGSFFQVNTPQAEVLYNVIKGYASLSLSLPLPRGEGRGEGRPKVLLDLYCGVGGIALWLASNFQLVLGIDDAKNAILDAQKNASLNKIGNSRFSTASAEQFLAGYRLQGRREDLTVVLDPPRAGCDPRVLSVLGRLKPSNLIYVSCDPGTLARDLAILARTGYTPRTIQPVDLFPHTAHIETVVHLPSKPR